MKKLLIAVVALLSLTSCYRVQHAEKARKQAEINKAEADKAYRNAMGMTTAEYLTLRDVPLFFI